MPPDKCPVGQSEWQAYIGYEKSVFRTAVPQAVIDGGHSQPTTGSGAPISKAMEQSHGIAPAGNGDKYVPVGGHGQPVILEVRLEAEFRFLR